ncbi:response regulator transcription factor [Clostridium sp. P21]|uniref:Stage 0 sporulation protein A homolog n=1 Tax=Clostridium muellerianum TaxID=2716538 RepID=A0A7Y0EIC4_9CLOT|nr:response regulator transcription factor [Clostridium muellerianum]NMM64016.1 response regulator transcription factor [Clostridium muellerianum]
MNLIKDKKILIVDDEPQILKMVETMLKKDGFYRIITAASFSEGLTSISDNKPDIALLDVMLPDGDGFTLLSEIKKSYNIPVIFLTARGEAEDKIQGLGLGADDYIVKPFLPKELTLRINAVLKRTYSSAFKMDYPQFELSACSVDLGKAEILKDGTSIQLTAKEHAILAIMYENSSKIVTADTLCQYAWGDDSYGYENTLMVHIRRIREKIETNPSMPVSLVTVKGLGYKLVLKDR